MVFETERPLAITQAQLLAAYVSDTENDTYELEGRVADLRQTLLRISGAIHVLEELLTHADE